MLTTLKLALAAAIAATGGYALNSQEAPTKPSDEVKTSGMWTLASSPIPQDDRLARKVSVKIEGTVSDVAKWLTEQGISFVISDQNLAQRKLMINLVDQPLKDAVAAIGEALGGTWVKKGDVYVFQSGMGFFGGDMKGLKWDSKDFPMPRTDMKLFTPDGKEFKKDGKFFMSPKDGKAFTWNSGDGKMFVMPKIDMKTFGMPKLDWKNMQDEKGRKLTEAERKKAEKAMQHAHEGMKRALEELEKAKMHDFKMPRINWKELQDEKGHKMTDAQRKDVEKAMKQAHEEMKKAKGHKLSDTEHREIEKAMKQAQEERMNAKGQKLTDAQRLHIEKSRKDAHKHMEKAREELKKSGNTHLFSEGHRFESGQISKLMKSLTKEQLAIHEKKGYLTPADLNPDQRKMLPIMDGDWNISFVVDGKMLKLKGK